MRVSIKVEFDDDTIMSTSWFEWGVEYNDGGIDQGIKKAAKKTRRALKRFTPEEGDE